LPRVSLFIPILRQPLQSGIARAKLLNVVLSAILGLLAPLLPELDVASVMRRTKTPLPPPHQQTATSSSVLDIGLVNPWPRLISYALSTADGNTIEVLRAFYVAAQAYGTISAGMVIGACNTEGMETHLGMADMDGSIFVRAAGLVLDELNRWGVSLS